jgi:hypothetical protein
MLLLALSMLPLAALLISHANAQTYKYQTAMPPGVAGPGDPVKSNRTDNLIGEKLPLHAISKGAHFYGKL